MTGRALLTGVANVVKFMGVEDVAEILREMKKDQNVAIEGCRPLKVKVIISLFQLIQKSSSGHD